PAVCDARPLSPPRSALGRGRREAREPVSRGRSVKARWLAALCLLLSCSLRHPHAGAHHHHHHGPGGPPTAPAKPPEQVTLVNVKLIWKPGSAPVVTARLQDGDRAEDIRPVTINGRLPMYEFRFARSYPGKHGGECASRFLVALGLDRPIE